MAKKRNKHNRGITLIKKSNHLIESRYKFDIWETRMFLLVLSNISREDENFKLYRIWYRDVIKNFGLKSAQSYELLRDAAKGLMRKVFYVSSFEDGFRRETEYHIIRTINYLSEQEKGKGIENQEYIDITIDPEMKPFLLQLQEKYTAYDLKNVINLGAYHVRIYELLKQYQSIGHRTLQINEIKRMLEISTEYPLFGNFFQKIIKPSIKAINKHTDITITKLEKIKEGRRVVALYFVFKLNERKNGAEAEAPLEKNVMELETLPNIPPTPVQQTKSDKVFNLYHEDVVIKLGVTPSVFLELVELFNEDQIQQALRVTRRAKFNQQIKTSVAGFFVQALKNGYTDSTEEATKKKQLKNKKDLLATQQLEVLEVENAKNINDRIRLVLSEQPTLTDTAIEALKKVASSRIIIAQKEAEFNRSLVLEDYRQDIRLRELVKQQITLLVPDRFVDIFEGYRVAVGALKVNG